MIAKNTLYKASFFLLLALSWLTVSSYADNGDLILTIKPERAQCISGEMVYADVMIKNVTDHALLIPTTWQLGNRLSVEIEGVPGRFSPFWGPIIDIGKEAVLLLEPSAHYMRSLSFLYNAILNSPGKHRIRAVFKSDGRYLAAPDGTHKDCWKGEVVSDWVEFEIIEPTSDEDKAAYAILTNNGTIDIWAALSPYEYEKAPSETWWRVIKEHPTSAYARLACEAEAQRIVNRPMPPDKEEWDEMRRLREFAEKHWPQDLLVDVIDAQIVACLYGDEKDKEAEELAAKIKERASCARVLEMLDSAKRIRGIVIAEEKRMREEAARNAQPPSPPPGSGPSPPPSTNAGGTSGPPSATDTGTSSEGGAEGAVAEAKSFPWLIVIVVAALALGAITTLLLTRAKKQK